ncbi:ATP-binding protein [Ruminococcus sp. OA3]|uniref:ATP-binding protein n=1 Tax=Ruminococcus sp. OA3 TaxID=2914164 RepID=UPI001F05F141|nr:ATP-binding protein [Ruminococcus sp. OA3]
MPLKNSQYDEIMRDYNRRQLHNKHMLDEHISEAYGEIPRLEEIDREISRLSIQKAKALLGAGETADFNLAHVIADLADERKHLLAAYGYPEDYLTMHYDCPLCCDTGYTGTEKCSCFKKAAINLLYTQSNIKEILKKENFDTFSYDYYPETVVSEATGLSALDTARLAVEKSLDFIRSFDQKFDNLFLYGDTGVGKTFLSHCIARELIDTAHCVIYFSAFDLFDLLAQNTFSRSEDSSELNEHIFDCDLLIIDDLGTELTNSFVASQLFLCINERLMREKSTLISTNLSLERFSEMYSERVFSRISSNYTMIKLIGNDIRIQKKLRGGNQ